MGEVFPLLQQKMQLDQRMLYAAELFLPDGTKITSFKQLREAADIDTAIIVGCGEPFDSSTVPQTMLSFHLHGGGREAPKVVKKELAEKKMRAAQPPVKRQKTQARSTPASQPQAGDSAVPAACAAVGAPQQPQPLSAVTNKQRGGSSMMSAWLQRSS